MKYVTKKLLTAALLTASAFPVVPAICKTTSAMSVTNNSGLESSNAGTAAKGSFRAGDETFLLNGRPFVVKAAELHYPRIPRPYWEHRIKMCKALGMNTLCLYVFWNIHEQREGVFDFSGNNDVAEFCRLAQKNGMYVIVRPGPYVCAEWEMGGLPWWLLKKKDIRLRERDPFFMERVRIFEKKVGEQLSPLTIQNGGPIIMVQVENEYGSYGEDKAYIVDIRDCLRSIYGDVALFQCDWASNFTKNGLNDLTWTMNFGTGADIDKQFEHLKQLRPHSPLMCSEFWSGWFDKWGARHETRPAGDMVAGIDEMLSKGISFSLYMTHGGTSFGHWAGANSPGFAPDVTSYDYDAPISEWGAATEKYHILRKTLEKYNDGKKLPAIPRPPMSRISVPEFKLNRVLSINGVVTAVKKSRDVLTMEDMDTGWGMIKYVTTLPEVPVSSMLMLNECHDFAQVYVNGRFIGKIDRVKNEKSITLPPVKKGDELTILVEAMGRINFGRAIKDYKGITKEVSISADIDGNEVTWKIKSWTISAMSDEYSAIENAMSKPAANTDTGRIDSRAGYYRGEFTIKKPGDTFISTEAFGKGQVWVNGHAIGRFWSVGPQQTLYVPGCWLKKGRNEVVVLDIIGPEGEAIASCSVNPELDKLKLEKTNKHNNPGDRPDLNSSIPVAHGNLAAGNGWQKVTFANPVAARYVALECHSTHSGDEVALAELYLNGADGTRISREQWTVKYADSENDLGNHTGDKAFDLQESTFWQTMKGVEFPHLLVIDLGCECTVTGFEYLPRAEQDAPGSVNEYKIFCY